MLNVLFINDKERKTEAIVEMQRHIDETFT